MSQKGNVVLFRKEALEHKQQSLTGNVFLVQPVAHWVYTSVALLVVAGAVFFLFWGTYARKERVQGYLVPIGGIAQVYPDHAGTVIKVEVKDGQTVSKGTPLLVITTEHHLAGGGSVGPKVLGQLENQREQVALRVGYTHASLARQQATLHHQITGLKQEIASLESQYKTRQQRVQTLHTQVQRYGQLYREGFLAQADYDKHRIKYLAAKSQVQQTHGQLVDRRNDLTRIRDKLASLPVDTGQQIAKLLGQKAQISQQYITTKGEYSYMLRAPIDGQVTSMQAHPGQAVRADRLLLSLVPLDSQLQAYLYVPTSAIGFVEAGQSVQLQYRAFPHERYGTYSGRIVTVGDAILKPREVTAPLALKQSVYRVKVALDSQAVKAYGKSWPLQAGMLLDADIVLSHHSLMQWILEPLYSLKGRL